MTLVSKVSKVSDVSVGTLVSDVSDVSVLKKLTYSQSIPPVSKTLQVVASVMAASVLPLLLGFSRRTAVKAKGRSRSTSPIGPTYRSCLFFPRAQTPSCR